jgi:hypothetical protein
MSKKRSTPSTKSEKKMAKQNISNPTKPAELIQHLEELRRDIALLSKRAETEWEALLFEHPQPVTDMLSVFAQQVSASEGMISFGPRFDTFSACATMPELFLNDSDRLQCQLACAGREMAMDFLRGRIYLPVVVFENPLCVAVFKVPQLNTANYRSVCAAACDGIGWLRRELKVSSSAHWAPDVAS